MVLKLTKRECEWTGKITYRNVTQQLHNPSEVEREIRRGRALRASASRLLPPLGSSAVTQASPAPQRAPSLLSRLSHVPALCLAHVPHITLPFHDGQFTCLSSGKCPRQHPCCSYPGQRLGRVSQGAALTSSIWLPVAAFLSPSREVSPKANPTHPSLLEAHPTLEISLR